MTKFVTKQTESFKHHPFWRFSYASINNWSKIEADATAVVQESDANPDEMIQLVDSSIESKKEQQQVTWGESNRQLKCGGMVGRFVSVNFCSSIHSCIEALFKSANVCDYSGTLKREASKAFLFQNG